MAKLSRNQLKGIVKECLIELLAEGLLNESSPAPRKKKRTSTPDLMNTDSSLPNGSFDDNITSAVNELTNDPLMTSIFNDTARTTLQEQMGAERAGPMVAGGDHATRTVASHDPDELFGEAADRWASLAFAEKKGQ